jgi:hypothetical protein
MEKEKQRVKITGDGKMRRKQNRETGRYRKKSKGGERDREMVRHVEGKTERKETGRW